MKDECEVSLCAAVIKRAIDDLSVEEVEVMADGKKYVHKHWKSAVEFLTGRDMETWLRVANIDGMVLRNELRKQRILGNLGLGLGSVGLVRVNQAQGFGWLYGN